MKKLTVRIMAGIMAMVMAIGLAGCGSKDKKATDYKLVSEVTTSETVKESNEVWTKHSFYGDDAEATYQKAKETADWFLMHGYTVSEILELETYNAKKYYQFKTRIA